MGGMGGGFGMGGFGNSTVSVTYVLTTSFKSMMQPVNFEHVIGSISKNMIEKIRNYEDRAFGSSYPEIQTAYRRSKNKVQYGYLTKWNNNFYVVDF